MYNEETSVTISSDEFENKHTDYEINVLYEIKGFMKCKIGFMECKISIMAYSFCLEIETRTAGSGWAGLI